MTDEEQADEDVALFIESRESAAERAAKNPVVPLKACQHAEELIGQWHAVYREV